MSKSQGKRHQILTFRVTDELLGQLEHDRKELQTKRPGTNVTMADIIREHILRGREHGR